MSHFYQEAEKFINGMFHSDTLDKSSSLDIPKLVGAKLKADDAEKDIAYYGHREGVVHSSQLYGCLRGTIHEMLGTEPDTEDEESVARKLGVFKAGNLFEDFVVSALGNRVVHAQREYRFRYKGILLVGRSDYTIDDEGTMRIGENKSVHSDAFWYREREGVLVQWHNQIQLNIYMWLERILDVYTLPDGSVVLTNEPTAEMTPAPEQKIVNPQGVFSYISKDDCTVVGTPVKFNQKVIDEVVIPALDIIVEGYTKKDANIAPAPALAVFNDAKGQYQQNWLCKYCKYHTKCAGAGWVLEATEEVKRLNKEHKAAFAASLQ